MKFAVISDIHGNLSAFEKVVNDALQSGVEGFILVGDYCISNPFPDECVEKIKTLPNLYAVRGNGENYLENLLGSDPKKFAGGQLEISYWCHKMLDDVNKDYVLSLPKRLDFEINGVKIHVAHYSQEFIGDAENKEWSTLKRREKYGNKFITREQLRNDAQSYFSSDEMFHGALSSLDDGIYIFGHTHIQWNYFCNRNKKIVINPGSCGIPCDCIKYGVPYTVLTIDKDGCISVEEKRVEFDFDKYIEAFYKSKQYKEARVWSEVIIKELKTRRVNVEFFLDFTEKYATDIGDTVRPFKASTWERSYELWSAEN